MDGCRRRRPSWRFRPHRVLHGRRIEHRQWVRNARREAYLRLLNDLDACTALRIAKDAKIRDVTYEELHAAMATAERSARNVMLLGPNSVLDLAQQLYEAVPDLALTADLEMDLSRMGALRNLIALFAGKARSALSTGR